MLSNMSAGYYYWLCLSIRQQIDIYLELYNQDLRCGLWGYKSTSYGHHERCSEMNIGDY